APGTDAGTAPDGSCSTAAVPGSAAATTTTSAPAVPGSVRVPSDDGSAIYTLGPLGFSGDALSNATAALDQEGWAVKVNVKGSQQAKANQAFNQCFSGGAGCPAQTQEGKGAIAIVLDGVVLSAPAVQAADLASDTFTITGDFDEGEAKDLALVLRYGSLPVEFEQAALQQVSATLGADSLRAGLIAGLLGIAALGLYMILYYRGFGWVVVVSLIIWSALMYGMLCFLSAQQGLALTLAGITGIIVSVGTTVDTYVVVFERIKDELRAGRSVRSATERGYQSGIKTVFTANGAAFIGAFLLWWLTVGPVRGFAYFLGLSVILDLAVAVLFTRPLILLLGRSPKFARSRFFGIGTATDQANRPKEALA
ncbi:MAG: secD, partial [Acidimicrobiales bacterium]|nr:secD [Acidimicrobiales bacterium]